MKRVLSLAILLATASPLHAMVKCRTPDGRLYYGDNPPARCAEIEAQPKDTEAEAARQASKVEQEIREHCAHEWRDDYTMQKDCVIRQARAFDRLKPWVNALPDDPKDENNRILGRCGVKWPGDYVMLEDCVTRQRQARDDLGR